MFRKVVEPRIVLDGLAIIGKQGQGLICVVSDQLDEAGAWNVAAELAEQPISFIKIGFRCARAKVTIDE